jgi:chloramphenicol-sensitive protein RarD
LLSINWGFYIWAVQENHIVDASLGYFITPLINILLGMIFLRERLRRIQIIAVILAAIGVTYFTIQFGSFPVIALILALSFGLYGLIRKKAPLNSTNGLSLETLMLFLPAAAYIVFLQSNSRGHWGQGSLTNTIFLSFAGVVTTIPLLLFGAAARRVTLVSLGIMQYVSPSLQFIMGVLVYHEPFSRQRLIGFGIIWIASILYAVDSVLGSLKKKPAVSQR